VSVEAIEAPRRIPLRLLGTDVIENQATRAVSEIEQTHNDAAAGTFAEIRVQWHSVYSWL
jgi:hypothetical protein